MNASVFIAGISFAIYLLARLAGPALRNRRRYGPRRESRTGRGAGRSSPRSRMATAPWHDADSI